MTLGSIPAVVAKLATCMLVCLALALALPLYPRAEGATFEGFVKGADGAEPFSDEKIKPFSGLADLFKKKPE